MGRFVDIKSYGPHPSYRCSKATIGNAIKFWNSAIASVAWDSNQCNEFLGLEPLNMSYVMKNPSNVSLKSGSSNCTGSISYYADSRYTYNTLTFVDSPVVVYVETHKISEIVPSAKFYYELVTHPTQNGNTLLYAFTGSTCQTYEQFISAHGNEIVVTHVKFYDNSGATPRPAITGYVDAYTRLSFVGVTDTMHNFEELGNGDFIFPLFTTLRSKDENSTNLYHNFAPEVFVCDQLTGVTCYGARDTATETGVSTYDNIFKAFVNINTLKGYLNQIGIPFAFVLSDALNTDTNKLPDYVPAGQPSDTIGGGTGTGDNDTDEVTNTTPAVSGISAFNSHYAMSQNMMGVLSDYLWNSTFLENIKLLFSSPAECLINCRMFPFSLSGHDTAHVGSDTLLTLGNVETTASGKLISNGYNCVFDLGSISVEEYYGSALDYSPYTTYQIYLPYLGIKDISASDIVGKTLNVKYVVDITTGHCIAEIFVGSQLLYTFDGSIGVDIPISSSNASQFATSNALTGLSGAGGVIAGVASGSPLIVAGSVMSTAKSVASNHLHVNKGGVNSPFAGFYMPQYAYLIIDRPVQSLASSFGSIHGFPCNVTKQLGGVSGYTEIESPVLTNIPATEEEKTQIKNLLETGVIIA